MNFIRYIYTFASIFLFLTSIFSSNIAVIKFVAYEVPQEEEVENLILTKINLALKRSIKSSLLNLRIEGSYTRDSSSALILYSQIYKGNSIIDAVAIVPWSGKVYGVKLDEKEIAISDEKQIEKLVNRLLIQINSNPRGVEIRDNINENLVDQPIYSIKKYNLAKEDLKKESSEVFKLLQTEEAVVTSATKIKQKVSQAPSIVTIITKEQIERRNYHSLAEILENVPGMYVNSDYSYYDIGVRGVGGELRGRSRLVKILINGNPMTFNFDTSNLVGSELIPVTAIEKIEILRGPASTVYGANAFLGVINIKTKSGSKEGGFTLRPEVSTFGSNFGYFFNGSINKKIAGFDFYSAFQFAQQNRSDLSLPFTTYDRVTNNNYIAEGYSSSSTAQKDNSLDASIFNRKSLNDISLPLSFLSNISYSFNKKGKQNKRDNRLNLLISLQRLSTTSSFSDTSILDYDSIISNGKSADQENTTSFIGQFNNIYALSYFFQLSANVKLSARYQLTHGGFTKSDGLKDTRIEATTGLYQESLKTSLKLNREDTGAITNEFFLDSAILLLDKKNNSLLNQINLISGVDYQINNVSYFSDAVLGTISDRMLTNFGLFSQLVVSGLNEKLGLTIGGRFDLNSYYDSKISYRIASTYELVKSRSGIFSSAYTKLLWGTAFKAPSAAFLFNESNLGNRPLNPNPDLKPQDVQTLEYLLAGSFFDNRLKLTSNYFFSLLQNKAVFNRKGVAIVAQNDATVYSHGVEATLKLKLTRFSYSSSISFQRSQKEFTKSSNIAGDRIVDTFGYPTVILNNTLGYTFHKLFTQVDIKYISERTGSALNRSDTLDNQYTLAGYILVNLHLSLTKFHFGKLPQARLILSVFNLFNTSYEFPGFQPYYKVDLPGRPIEVRLSYEQTL